MTNYHFRNLLLPTQSQETGEQISFLLWWLFLSLFLSPWVLSIWPQKILVQEWEEQRLNLMIFSIRSLHQIHTMPHGTKVNFFTTKVFTKSTMWVDKIFSQRELWCIIMWSFEKLIEGDKLCQKLKYELIYRWNWILLHESWRSTVSVWCKE